MALAGEIITDGCRSVGEHDPVRDAAPHVRAEDRGGADRRWKKVMLEPAACARR